MTDGGKAIHNHLSESNKVLKVSKGAPAWRAYVEFINNILATGIAATIVESLKFLYGQVDPATAALDEEFLPLLEVRLELREPVT